MGVVTTYADKDRNSFSFFVFLGVCIYGVEC